MDLSPYLRFDGAREKKEWFESEQLHPALYVVVLAAALWHYRRTGKPVVITHILRTRAEQRSYYPDDPDKRSLHEFGQAADLRTRDLDLKTVREWAEYINDTFKYFGSVGIQTALVHDIGMGRHFHIQIGPHESRPAKPETFIEES